MATHKDQLTEHPEEDPSFIPLVHCRSQQSLRRCFSFGADADADEESFSFADDNEWSMDEAFAFADAADAAADADPEYQALGDDREECFSKQTCQMDDDDPTFVPLTRRAMSEKLLHGAKRVHEPMPEFSDSSDEENLGKLPDDNDTTTAEDLEKLDTGDVGGGQLAKSKQPTESPTRKVKEKLGGTSVVADESGEEVLPRSFRKRKAADSRYSLVDHREFACGCGRYFERQSNLTTHQRTCNTNEIDMPKWGPKRSRRYVQELPESLVGKSLKVKNYEESSASSEEWTRFIIAGYDASTGKHRLESARIDTGERDGDVLVSLDLRTIARENIAWEDGQDRTWK